MSLPRVDFRSPRWLWGPVVLQLAIIFAASSIPNLTHLPGDISDKSGHSIGYAMLAGVLLRALAGGRLQGVTWKRVLATIALSTLYGVTDEFHQLFVPGRSADPYDVLADCVGSTIGTSIGWLLSAARRWGILGSSS